MKKLSKNQQKLIAEFKSREQISNKKPTFLPMGVTGEAITGVRKWG